MRGRDCQLDSLRQKLADAEENVNQVAREREGTEAELAQARDGLSEVQARVDVSKRENEEWMAKVEELRGRAGVAEQRGLETASQVSARPSLSMASSLHGRALCMLFPVD